MTTGPRDEDTHINPHPRTGTQKTNTGMMVLGVILRHDPSQASIPHIVSHSWCIWDVGLYDISSRTVIGSMLPCASSGNAMGGH